ncbi:hypothetical protein BC831DRAFT_67273 [Entophlyctis helioformis]|nr:hypothetical protein BC831DRAFT_67273 [Entophlyctis helioformis]
MRSEVACFVDFTFQLPTMAPIAPAARAAPVPVAPVSAHRSRREDGIAHASNAASVSAAAPRTMPDIAIGIAAIANSAPSAGRHSAAAAPSMARAAQASARGSTPAAVVERLFEPAAGAASPTGSSSSTNGTNDTSMRRVSAENDPHDASSDVSESPLGQPSITSTVPSRTLQQQPPAPAQAGIASNMAHPYGTENALNNLSLRLSAQGLHFHPVNRQGSLFRAVAEHVHHNQHMYKAAMHECTQFANVHCQEYLSMPASMNLPRNPADFHSSVRLLGKQSATFVQAHGGRDGTDGLAPQTFEFQLLADTFQRPVMVYSIQQPAAGASGLRLQSYTPQLMRQSAARSLSDDPGPPIRLACLDRQWFVPVFVTTTTCEQPSAAQHGESLPTTGRPSARKSVRISEKTAHDLERERQQDELAASIASQIRETFSRGEEKLYNGPQDRPDIALIECGCASVDEFHASAATQGTPLNSTSTNTGTGTANPGAPATSRSNFTPQSRFLQLEQYTVPAQSSADSNSENDMDMNSSSQQPAAASSQHQLRFTGRTFTHGFSWIL